LAQALQAGERPAGMAARLVGSAMLVRLVQPANHPHAEIGDTVRNREVVRLTQ